MRQLPELFERNRAWAARLARERPGFFDELSRQQSPRYLWIGCSDSRVPANEIVGLLPGELFVHRNVANLVVPDDLNCLSVLQYAVDVLKVEHVIVCGHYGCGGVAAAQQRAPGGLVDRWLHPIRETAVRHRAALDAFASESERLDRLCELNVIEQAAGVCDTEIVREAWGRGQPLAVHGWIYALADGLLRDLGFCVRAAAEVAAARVAAIAAPPARAAS